MYKIQCSKVLSLNNLSSYINAINAYQVLSVDEEQTLAKQVYYHSDVNAAKKIILSNLKFVVYIARNYSGYGLSQSDLIQEGNIGLMKAVRRFNPNINVRVISFAVHWIKSSIHEYILKNWRIVKIATTKSQRKLFFNLRKTKKRLGWCSDSEIKFIAQELGVTVHDVEDMELKMSAQDINLYSLSDNDEKISNNISYYLSDEKSDFAMQLEEDNWGKYTKSQLNDAISHLDERSRYIIHQRWLNGNHRTTLKKIATNYGISAERVRQLEKNAINKLKKEIIKL